MLCAFCCCCCCRCCALVACCLLAPMSSSSVRVLLCLPLFFFFFVLDSSRNKQRKSTTPPFPPHPANKTPEHPSIGMLQVGSRFNSMDRPFARHPAAAATAAVTLTVNQLSMPVPPSPSSTSNTAAAAAATAKSNQSRHSHLFMLQNSSEPGSPIAPATRASAGSGTADPSWQKFESLSLDDSDIYKGNNITVSSSADQRVSDNLLLNGPSPTSLAAPGDNAWKAVGSTGRSPPRMTGCMHAICFHFFFFPLKF